MLSYIFNPLDWPYSSYAWVMRSSLVSLFLQLSFTAATPVREAAIFICGRPRARRTHHSRVAFSHSFDHLRPTCCFASLGDAPTENVQQVKRHWSPSGRDTGDDFSSDRHHFVSHCPAVGYFYLKFKRLCWHALLTIIWPGFLVAGTACCETSRSCLLCGSSTSTASA